MKNIILAATVILICAFSGNAQKKAMVKTDPAKDVRAAFDRLIEGVEQVDVNKVMDAYENSDRLLIFNNNGTATIGWSNVKSNLESSYPKITNVSLETTGIRIELLGRTSAYLSCKWTQSQEFEGKLESASGRMTLVYRLIGKNWKIVHRHTSPDNPPATRPVLPSEREEN
jgi:ketosteroid isomerase-like protein